MSRLLLLLSLLGCSAAAELSPADAGTGGDVGSEPLRFRDPATVLRVVDGDTLEVETEAGADRLRLKGIDTPEFGRRGDPAEPFAEAAKAHAQGRVGSEVGLEFDRACGSNPLSSDACRDGFGRLLCYLRLADGSDLNEELLRLGLAEVYRVRGERFDRQFAYEEAEAAARQEGLGIWGP